MSDAAVKYEADEARDAAYTTPLEAYDVADPNLFMNNTMWPYFERLRKEAPVHYSTVNEEVGPYWSVTRYKDIMAVDTNHQVFSSEGSIVLRDQDEDFQLPMFIAMDPPKHDEQRKVVSPIVAPANLAKLESTIRERLSRILDELPENEPFNWVDRVSIELTTQMLATLFDFPFEERRKLTRWSDVATATPMEGGIVETEDQRRAELLECAEYFIGLWNERVNAREPGNDLISMLAHGESTRNMDKMEYLGNLILLIVGGNDTTRNSLSGGLYALNQFPEQYRKLQENPGVIPNMVAEIIRWQTPLAYMRRTALEDVELGGQKIRKGDKVAMWYVSGNRDDSVIENPNELIIDRERARQHLSFGFGIHRCVGNRLAEMQLRITWEEIMKRWPDQRIEVLQEPRRVYSSFVKGYEELMVVVPKRKN
ncbi:cytochrome P450 [Parvibaculum sp.]|jgi:cytochrome P450|uniref:cytochrome P450 n=1 Tax=Parvibaculum sp. TaxID=2024848 RepID=UPI000C502893|nr:cytochrome P450 [Parvibaculum sp.]HAC59910.1 cytochrome P450 [Rhodobiaceae bacterium]MAU61460.1 cytochrome P450 [Parvibaculum sp.]MBO6668268.1 cytochrome P450 [Parvibaculum sp.]MBO6691012.1 cytochrome P450 [Parvibaculum sp.]MBO6714614.1 cytochrome P450 [Parvibaculum sp.]|tara:strand:- start:6845 stop:8119 length:1275 start_codon:yes stop_codon:yes gene_type:complete